MPELESIALKPEEKKKASGLLSYILATVLVATSFGFGYFLARNRELEEQVDEQQQYFIKLENQLDKQDSYFKKLQGRLNEPGQDFLKELEKQAAEQQQHFKELRGRLDKQEQYLFLIRKEIGNIIHKEPTTGEKEPEKKSALEEELKKIKILNNQMWAVGGGKGGFDGLGRGGGRWYDQEIVAEDIYLQARATTPASGNTYGATAWLRTAYNFNDKNNWMINFKWETDIQTRGQWHADYHLIEITDGRTDWLNAPYLHPQDTVLPGTQQLYLENGKIVTPQTWSIFIDSNKSTATLYESPHGDGPIHSTKPLDTELPWHIRFTTVVGTSAGFPAKDCRINLYDFSADIAAPKN